MGAVSHSPAADLAPVDGMTLTPEEFEQIVLADASRRWELHRGTLREKPLMSAGHHLTLQDLSYQLIEQLDKREFVVRTGYGHLTRPEKSFYIPDLFVVPAVDQAVHRRQRQIFELYRNPLPLIVEIWSPSTGPYDVNTKLPEYVARGDWEIWRLHPFERTLRAWRRRADGQYDVSDHTGGVIEPIALPGVKIDLDALFGDAE